MLASIQWASSTIKARGPGSRLWRMSAASASSVSSRRFSGVTASSGEAPFEGIDNNPAKIAAVVLSDALGHRRRCAEFLHLNRGRVETINRGVALQLPHDGVKGAVLALGHAIPANSRRCANCKLFVELLDQPGLADPGLAQDFDGLAASLPHARPGALELLKLGLAADKWRGISEEARVEAARGVVGLSDLPRLDGSRKALERNQTEIAI